MTNKFKKAEQIVSFLVAARHECINSILLDDFLVKMQLLEQHEEFSGVLDGFTKETIMPILQKLESFNVIHTYHNGNNMEIMSTNPIAQASVWEQQLTEEEKTLYLSMANTYRHIGTNMQNKRI